MWLIDLDFLGYVVDDINKCEEVMRRYSSFLFKETMMSLEENGSNITAGPLLSEFRDDPDLIELVEYFVEEMPNTADKIKEACDTKDMESLRRLSHQLKGSAGGYGFSPITDSARVLEEAIMEEKAISEVKQSVDELVALCKRVSL